MNVDRVLRRPRLGQALVEFTFVLLAFSYMTMGIIDLGRGILYYNMLSNAAREGARYGIISSHTSDEICATVISASEIPGVVPMSTCGTTSDGNLTVAVPQRGTSGDPSTNDPGTPVEVTVSYHFYLITPFLTQIIQGANGTPYINIHASSTMYVEG